MRTSDAKRDCSCFCKNSVASVITFPSSGFGRGAFDPNGEVIAAFDRGRGRLRFHGLREIFPRFLETRWRRVKSNLGQRDPRLRSAFILREIAQKTLERGRGFPIALRCLHQPLLQSQFGSRLLVLSALAQRLVVRQEARIVAELQPGKRCIENRGRTKSGMPEPLETGTGRCEFFHLIICLRGEPFDSLRDSRLRMQQPRRRERGACLVKPAIIDLQLRELEIAPRPRLEMWSAL